MVLSADILRGYTDAIILCQLRGGDSYGYQINKRIAEMTNAQFELKEATLYTAFRRLETGGYINSYWGDENSGARRKYYAILPAGREMLQQSLADWHATRQLIDQLLEGSK